MFEFVIFDYLLSLRKGHELTRCGESALTVHLPGAPFAYVAFDYLHRNALIWPMHGGDDAVQRWVLSNRGYDYYCRVAAWYRALPLHMRIIGRLGLGERWILHYGPTRDAGRVWKELA